jgi:hypothetical protein
VTPRLRRPTVRASVTELLVLASYSVIAVAITWPALRHLSTRLLGDSLDPVQTLWGFWWLRHAGELGGTPYFSPALWWPDGVSLWLQSWDVPSAILAVGAWSCVPAIAVYNVLVLLTFPMSGFALYLLGRELFGGRMAPFLAGCLYTFSTYHLAHSQAQLHLASMQWSPLFVLSVTRACRTGKASDAVFAGASLGMATLASVYHFVFCVVLTLILTATGAFGPLDSSSWRRICRVGATAAVTFILLAGWSVIGMLLAYLSEPYVGAHDAVRFSADLQSFFLPNAVSLWSEMNTSWTRWSGNVWESAAYVGYVVLVLALVAGRESPTARRYLWIALAGALLALGPLLHFGGHIFLQLALPAAWIQWLVPAISFSGLPTRYSWLTTFGLSIAACATLSRLCAKGRIGALFATILTAASLAETWPKQVQMSSWPQPSILEEWSRDPERWAVLDATRGARPLWHQMAHRHPVVAGYVTRTPQRLWNNLQREDVLTSLLGPPLGSYRQASVTAADARRKLRSLQIRFVIVEQERAYSAERLGLVERERAHDLVVYQVPAD